jgi:lipopolysaccharide transport protein LptA
MFCLVAARLPAEAQADPVKAGTAAASTGGPQVGTAAASASKANPSTNSGPFGAFDNTKNRGPVNIQSESMSLDYKGNSVTFIGHVHATQADGVLTSKTLQVKYGKDFKDVQQMIADGDVRMSQGVQWCTSDHTVQDQTLHTVVMTGNPVCHNDKDQIAGSKITVHTDTSISEVEGGVKAVVFPHEGKTSDNQKAGTQQQ